MYGFGEAERILGNAFKALNVKREEIVVTTKLFWGEGRGGSVMDHIMHYKTKGVNESGLSRKKVIESTRAALKRLQLDYVDVIYAHRPDQFTPLEETCRAFSWVIDQGWAFYWGTSEWDADTIMEAIGICERLGLHPPCVDQCQYNMTVRGRMENDYRSLFEKHGYGTTVWGPMAGGFLSGRYNDGNIPDDSRFNKFDPFWGKSIPARMFTGENKEKILRICRGLAEIAAELGYTQAQLALAWVLASTDVSTLIIGFSKLEQLEENIKALELYGKWNKELEARIEALLGNAVETRLDFRQFCPLTSRRLTAVFDAKK